MTIDASVNTGADPVRDDPDGWVSRIQTKLHCWAAADPGRRLDDLFNLVHDPAILAVAWDRVATNRGARSAGSDGITVARIETEIGSAQFLSELRMQLRTSEFGPQPVRERKIPKPGGSGRKRGSNRWHVYTFIADRCIRSVKAKVRARTRRTSQADLKDTLIWLNQIQRGWVNYFRHAIAQRTFDHVRQFTWWRVVRWQRTRRRWNWTDVRRWLTTPTGKWRPIHADGIELFNPAAVPIRRYRYRGQAIPNPFVACTTTA